MKRVRKGIMLPLFIGVNMLGAITIAKEYSDQVVEDFMQGCALTEDIRPFCQCTIKNMSNFATEEEFTKIVDEAHKSNNTDHLKELSIKAMEECEALLP